MALSEMTQRKNARTAQQGQMGQQQQPRVVDQAIADMSQGLPENSGIGMLPAPNMQSMAGGGITGFSGEQGSFVSDGGEATSAFGRFLGPAPRKELSAEEIAAAQKKRDDQARLDAFNNDRRKRINAATPNLFTPTTQAQRDRTAQEIAAIEAELPPGVSNVYPDTNAQRFPAPGIAPPGAATTGAAPAPAPAAATARAVKKPETGIAQLNTAVAPDEDYMTQLDAIRAKQRPAVDELSTQRQKLVDTANTNAATALEELKAEQNAQGVAGKGREERIAKREAGITADRQTNKAFSFINAGLAMMQSRGQGLAGIAEGAMVGTKQYGEGIAKIKLAQEKADEARDKLDELRRNESTMDSRERRAANIDLRKTALDGRELMLAGVAATRGVSKADARAAVNADMNAEEKRAKLASDELIARNRDATTMRAASVRGSNAGAGMDLREQRVQLDALKTQLTSVNATLNNRNSMLDLPRNAGQKATLLAERQQLMAAIAQFGPPASANPVAPPAVSGTGNDGFKVLGSRPAP